MPASKDPTMDACVLLMLNMVTDHTSIEHYQPWTVTNGAKRTRSSESTRRNEKISENNGGSRRSSDIFLLFLLFCSTNDYLQVHYNNYNAPWPYARHHQPMPPTYPTSTTGQWITVVWAIRVPYFFTAHVTATRKTWRQRWRLGLAMTMVNATDDEDDRRLFQMMHCLGIHFFYTLFILNNRVFFLKKGW